RPDADLVFADAGRRAARRAVRRMSGVSRLAAHTAPRLFGHGAARRAARAVLGAELGREERLPVARVSDPIAIQATPDGSACGFYGAGLVELLRLLVGYEGAMLHVACRARGSAGCGWRELHEKLRALVAGKTVAMEISPGDAVPYLDRVPHGVIELIEGFGAKVVSSGTLITRFAARWSASELAGHRRAAEAIAEIALTTWRWAGSE